MQQAGIKNITLIENKGVTWVHHDPFDLWKIANLEYTGDTILLDNINRPKFDISINRTGQGIVYEYELDFILFDYIASNLDYIDLICDSIYGWCMLVEFYDETVRFYPNPIYYNESDLKPHEEMVFNINMETRVGTLKRHYEYIGAVANIDVYRADTTIITADSETYTADYSL